MGRLQGKVAIITGGGQGLGRGMALAMAKEGAKIVIAEINPKSGDVVVKEIADLGHQAIALVCDVGKEDQVKKMVDQAVKAFGPIDILVNNAQSWDDPAKPRPASPTPEPVESFSEIAFDHTFQTGFKATWYCSKAVFPYMKNRGGKIINMVSSMGLEGTTMALGFNVAKEAIRCFSRTAAREWGPYNINVNCILPAAVTPALEMYTKIRPEHMADHLKATPMGRWGHAENDIGRTAVFLASSDSDYITGETIKVNGGRLIFAL